MAEFCGQERRPVKLEGFQAKWNPVRLGKRDQTKSKHDPEKLADFSHKIMRPSKEVRLDRRGGRGENGAMTETRLDLRGLKCPLPALKTRKALQRLATRDLLIVECTDPLAEIDIPHLARETGDALEGTAREGDVLVFRIRKQ